MSRRGPAVLALVAAALIAVASISLDSESASAASLTLTPGDGTIDLVYTTVPGSGPFACINIRLKEQGAQSWSRDFDQLRTGNNSYRGEHTLRNLDNGKTYEVEVQGQSTYNNGCTGDLRNAASGTVVLPIPQQPQQPQAAAAYYEIVLRGEVERASNEDEREALTLYFPTGGLSDCDNESDADCGSLSFPNGVYADLDEAVSETVRENVWGSYVVTDEVGTARDWERRFRAWLDTERLGFELEGRRYFALSGRAVFDLDLWVIYYMAERGMNSVRLAERPFEPMLTVCLPRPSSAGAGAVVAVWDKKAWGWRLLESVANADEGQICALTPFVTVFALVEGESVSELSVIP